MKKLINFIKENESYTIFWFLFIIVFIVTKYEERKEKEKFEQVIEKYIK